MALIPKLTRVLLFFFLLCGGLFFARDFLVPVTFGGLLAMLLVPVCNMLEAKGVGKALAATMCVLLFVAVAGGIIALLTWQVGGLAEDASDMMAQMNKVPARVQQYIQRVVGIPVAKQQEMIKEQSAGMSSKAGAQLALIAGSAASIMGTTLLVIIYIFLFIFYREHLSSFVLKMVAVDDREKAKGVIASGSRVAQQYISGLAMMVGILWVMYGIGFTIIGIKHALFFALLCGLLEIMPYVGNLTGTTITAAMAYAQGGSSMALWVLAVYAVVQFTQTYLLEPLVVGAKVNINPLCTIVIIVVGEMIWGIPGMMLAIPLLGIIKIICDNVPQLQPVGFLIGEVRQRKPLFRRKSKENSD